MNTGKFSVFVFLVTLLVSLAGHVAAQDGRHTGNARTDRATGIMNGSPCGPDLACNATQYCSVLIAGPKGVPPSYRCVEAPGAGPSPTCKTIPDPGVGCKCIELNGGITVTCTAP